MPGSLMHVALFTWQEDTDPGHGELLARELRSLAADLSQILFYRCGPDLDLYAASCDFAVVSVVGSAEDLAAYLAHPRHQQVVEELVSPVLRHRVTSQIALHADDPLTTWSGGRGGTAP